MCSRCTGTTTAHSPSGCTLSRHADADMSGSTSTCTRTAQPGLLQSKSLSSREPHSIMGHSFLCRGRRLSASQYALSRKLIRK